MHNWLGLRDVYNIQVIIIYETQLRNVYNILLIILSKNSYTKCLSSLNIQVIIYFIWQTETSTDECHNSIIFQVVQYQYKPEYLDRFPTNERKKLSKPQTGVIAQVAHPQTGVIAQVAQPETGVIARVA